MNTQANMLRKVGREDEAIEFYRQALSVSGRVLGEQHPDTINLENNLAISLLFAARMDEAVPHNIRVVNTLRRVLGEDHRSTNESLCTMQDIVRALASAPHGRIGVWQYTVGPPTDPMAPARGVTLIQRIADDIPESGGAWTALGMAHYQAGNWKLAIEAWETSTHVRNATSAVDSLLMSMAHWQLGQPDHAHELYDQAIERVNDQKNPDGWYCRFRDEAAELLGITESQPATDPKATDN
jgi:tetratricopeptide (TPR) repeat protein